MSEDLKYIRTVWKVSCSNLDGDTWSEGVFEDKATAQERFSELEDEADHPENDGFWWPELNEIKVYGK